MPITAGRRTGPTHSGVCRRGRLAVWLDALYCVLFIGVVCLFCVHHTVRLALLVFVCSVYRVLIVYCCASACAAARVC